MNRNLYAGTFILIMAALIVWLSRFRSCPVIAVAAKPGGPEAPDTTEAQGITELIEVRVHSAVCHLHLNLLC